MFSAVALIAFSFAGMANTGTENQLNNEIDLTVKKQTTENVVVRLAWNECDQLAEDVWNAFQTAGMSNDSSYAASSAAYNACITQ
jgi:hypothetical protein